VPAYDVVIPARNEEITVGGVVRAARGARGVGRVVVVDDGSSDDTAAVARAAGASVVSTLSPGPAGDPGRTGDKGRALDLGVAATSADVLVFFDADILGTLPHHFETLAGPVLSGASVLSCGIVDYGWKSALYLRLPPITGLRALQREVFLAIPEARRNGFRIEIMINEVVARRRLPSAIRVLGGLAHRSKIDKVGWRRGLPAHLAMTGELLGCLRDVPLWTYGAYLSRLTVLPPAGRPRHPGDTGSSAPLLAP
jgi:polyisoprenyl-phosphate glycosyltransferase